MTRALIKDPPQRWPAKQLQTVRVVCTLRTGLVLADYGTVTLTVREDPLWPRSGTSRVAADSVDPLYAGWPESASATGTVISLDTVDIDVTVPSSAGERRYAFDVVADGGVAGRIELVPATWLTVTPSLLE